MVDVQLQNVDIKDSVIYNYPLSEGNQLGYYTLSIGSMAYYDS